MGIHWAGLRTKDIGIPPSLWTDADANGLAKPRMTACRSRHAEGGKYVGANPSLIEGGYSPMTGPEVSRGRSGFKTRAARRRTSLEAGLRSADDYLGATARSGRSLAFGARVKFDLVLLTRIFVGSLLGCVIGWDREARGSAAGDRTFGLVSLGAAAFTAAGVEHFPATAEKVMAGIVTGVGFLGAGMIFRDGDTMRGLTSAAALWAAAAVGMLAGIGEFLIATLTMALILLILEARYLPVLRRLEVQSWRKDGERGEE
jgi:putative Mg2+ transporter-C (MgtC) family protein